MFIGNIYLDMLESIAFMQLEEDVVEVFQKDGVMLH
jgi:hypothetical protein